MDKDKEYEMLAGLERETTKTRHTTFTAILGVGFVLPGLAVQASSKCPVSILGLKTDLSALVFFLGFVFYLFAVFHYHWYHRHAHAYRKRLKDIEAEIGVDIYRLRTRPQLGPFKLHFEWALHIIGGVYAVATIAFIGWQLFLAGMLGLLLPYILLVITSAKSPVEPMEEDR